MNHVRSDVAPGREACVRHTAARRSSGRPRASSRRSTCSEPRSTGKDPDAMVDDNVGNTSDRPEAGRLPLSLALLPLRDTVLFPQSILPLAAGRAASLKLIEEAARGDRTIGVITQRDPAAEEPGEADLHRIGTVATIHKVVKQPDGTLRLVVQGLRRFRILELTQTRPYLLARVEEMDEVAADGDLETEALVRNATTLFRQIVELSPLLPDELAGAVQNVTEPGRLADVIARVAARAQHLGEAGAARDRRRQGASAAAGRHAHQGDRGPRAGLEDPVAGGVRDGQGPARVLPARAAQGHPEGARPDRRPHAGARRAAREDRGGADDRGSEEGSAAGARPAGQDAARGRRVHGGADVSRLAHRAAVEQGDHGPARPRRGARPSSTRTTRGSRRSRTASSSTSP